ncbi:MAG: hypothetical protein ACJ75A_17640 [Actinomycetes bacterium]
MVSQAQGIRVQDLTLRGPADARMDAVLGTLQDGEAGPVLVAQAGQVVGIITPSDRTHRPPRQQRSTSAPPEPVEWAARPQ